MNKLIKWISIILITGISALMAFDNPLVNPVIITSSMDDPTDISDYNDNPATVIYKNNMEQFGIQSDFAQNGYKRLFDPESSNLYNVSYSTLRKISDGSFFEAMVSYQQYNQKNIYSTLEKDFYDDYFSMIDSTLGNSKYYGPQLHILYNVKLADNFYLGIQGDYGVERSLKDTFPKTITIMRNSSYQIGLDYRRASFGIGIHGRYYDDQKYYEAVKSYSDVITKTYFGYNIYYNELSESTVEKRRTRNGFDFGGHLRLGGDKDVTLFTSVSALHRISRADLLRSSTTKPRGVWERDGLHVLTCISITPNSEVSARLYGEYLHYVDWGKSMISNALAIENDETYAHAGVILSYSPSLVQRAMVGAEVGHVAYDYEEFVFPFSDTRSGFEWKLFTGASLYLSLETKLNFNLEYGKEVPKFYWNTDFFQNTGFIINLEQLFSFGYIELGFENISKKPSNDSQIIKVMQMKLSYRRK